MSIVFLLIGGILFLGFIGLIIYLLYSTIVGIKRVSLCKALRTVPVI